MTFAEKVISFNRFLHLHLEPGLAEVMNPFRDQETLEISNQFYRKYFNDNGKRIFIFGINPGRFGAGVTGIPFTDPINLEMKCGIKNKFAKKPELSSQFIYRMIEDFGGVNEFYSRFYITAVSPLGFLNDGRNMNYYDSAELTKAVTPFIVESIRKQIDFGAFTESCLCIGDNKNFAYLSRINNEYRFFNQVIPLEHPRYIMQYRRKQLSFYINKYLSVLHDHI